MQEASKDVGKSLIHSLQFCVIPQWVLGVLGFKMKQAFQDAKLCSNFQSFMFALTVWFTYVNYNVRFWLNVQTQAIRDSSNHD